MDLYSIVTGTDEQADADARALAASLRRQKGQAGLDALSFAKPVREAAGASALDAWKREDRLSELPRQRLTQALEKAQMERIQQDNTARNHPAYTQAQAVLAEQFSPGFMAQAGNVPGQSMEHITPLLERAWAAKEAAKARQAAAALVANQRQGPAMSPEAIQYAAEYFRATGKVPQLGRGSENNRTAIVEAAARGAPLPAASTIADFNADKGSLTKLQQMSDAVVAYENTAGKNLDLFLRQAATIPDSASPWVNTPLRALDDRMLGSPQMAAFKAARQVALTEIARVVNNPNLVGVLSDNARREIESIVPENATLAQIVKVAEVLRQDMANRKGALQEQINVVRGRMGGVPQQQQPGSPPPATDLKKKYGL